MREAYVEPGGRVFRKTAMFNALAQDPLYPPRSQMPVIAITWLVLKTTGSGTKIGLVLALYAADGRAVPGISRIA